MASVSADDESPHSPDQPIKRATIVYGKRSNYLPLLAAVLPTDGQSFEHGRSPRDPSTSSQPRRSLSPSVYASDSERSRGPDVADPFQFGFRHRLKELDDEFDQHDAPSREAVWAGPSQVKDPQSVSMGTPNFSFEARRSPGAPSLSPTSLRATSVPDHLPESPVVHRRTRRVTNPLPSDSEAEVPSDSSGVSPIRHAITTPHSRSSPTPPTSSEVPMISRKTKTKGKAPTRDVLPLVFEDEQPLAAELPKSKKGRRSEPLARPKTKAPTKKERQEAALESSRIAANRPVEVTRTQQQKHSLAAFFATVRRDNITIPTSGAELPSDPIERFSSPTDNATRVSTLDTMFGAPTGLLRDSAHVRTSDHPSSQCAFPPAADDSDDEMPSVTSIIQRESGKKQRLQAMKEVALQHADNRKVFGIDDEDEDEDLLIVKEDMHAVAREEAAQRRLDKVHGSPVKNMATLRRINHPSVRPAVISPRKFSRQELRELAKPSFARSGKVSKGQLTKKQLDHLMIMQHTEEQLKSIKRQEEEWIKGGGRLSRDADDDGPQASLSQKLGAYAELGLKATDTDAATRDEASADENDEDYDPDLRDSASPNSTSADEDDCESSDRTKNSQVLQPPVDDDEETVAPLRRHKSGQRHSRVVLGSDDECPQVDIPRNSASSTSMESQTEDENDKENSAKLMYDRSEDKENKAVVRHELSTPKIAFGPRLHSVEDGIRGSLSLASATDFNDATGSSKGDVRLPLKEIAKDDDLSFSTPSGHSPCTDGPMHTAVISSTFSLGSPPLLKSERIARIKRLSLDSENDENDPSGFKPLEPSFLERLRSQVSPEPSLAAIQPLANGGFSQLFSAEDRTLTKPIESGGNNELSLTLDVGLKPALEVNGTLKQKAETIFEKEQEYVVAAALQQTTRPNEPVYVNDYGFLTQTRPEGSSPQVYRMTPSQASKFIGTQVHSTQIQPFSARPPLRTLSFAASQELSPELQPLRRLRRRSLSPLEHKLLGQNSNPVGKLNAFSVLGKALKPPPKAQKELGKSEFVAVEAEESDEDDMFGFGGPKKDDGEEEDDDEVDKIVEGLVDDTTMDAETEAADLVMEKHREHVEEDDQRLQKLHQDAVEGKFRTKRRDGGVGLDYDSDDDGDDDEARRIRQRIRKKRRIEGDSLEALGQNEETKAFYNTYHQDLVDEDEFGHLRDVEMPVDDHAVSVAEPEEQETVSVDEIRQRVREVAQNNMEAESLDPEDTSWIDQSMMIEADDAVRVKVVDYRRSKPMARYPKAGQVDFDAGPSRHVVNEQERKQMTSWARSQSNWRKGTGRSGNSTAVTSHTKVKAGGGSLRSSLKQPPTVSESRKTKTSSLLSIVPDRRGKFA